MKLTDLWAIILESSREDWHFIEANPSHHGAHNSVAVYIPNVSITLAWGLKSQEGFPNDWCNKFSAPSTCAFADVFFNNALVYRIPYIWVDGIFFPNPLSRDKGIQVTKNACTFMKLLESMSSPARPDHHLYEVDLRKAGFTVVNEEWPELPEV